MTRSWLALVIVLAGCPQPPPAPVRPPPTAIARATGLVPPQPTLRLPKNFAPSGYTARLDIDPSKPTFEGSIAIAGVVDQPSSVIWLHGRHLNVRTATATKDTAEIPITVTARGEDLLELRADVALQPGEWTLMIDYAGEFEQVSTTGAFKQIVGDAAYVYTQLEAIYARRVFPCVDEPDSKVPWKLTLDVPASLVAVANTPVTSDSKLADNKRRVEFAVTKPLPSYLIAFGVGPFEIVDGGKTAHGTPVRILTLANRAADGAYAAQTTVKLLELTEDWFGMPYPYPKLDMLAIPLTVGFGAMENAGLITFTETLMLIDPGNAARSRQQRWVMVAAHEIAHQWFGDLVTMAYWNDIWLNEGFANWLEIKTVQAFEPAWHAEHLELDQRAGALSADSLINARQIRQPIVTTNDILNAFDGITYNKGASVLRTFEHYVGPEVFQQGVRDYLTARAWGNATSTDFVAAIGKVAGRDLGPAFATYLEQAGAPEVTATVSCAGTPMVELEQRRYVAPGSPVPPPTSPWAIPVCVAYEAAGKRAEACTLLERARGSVALNTRGCPRWVMPNVGAHGYYRSAYTTAQLTALRDEAWPQLSWDERRAIVGDVHAAVAAGKAPLMLALSFVPKLLAGNDRFTVSAALSLPVSVNDWVPDPLRGKYEHWLRQVFGAGARQAGLVPIAADSIDIEAVRDRLVDVIAWTARDPELIDQAVELADRWRELPQSIRGLVLRVAVDARPAVFDKILEAVATETDRVHRAEMYGALASVRDPAHQRRALALILDPKRDIRETLGMVWSATGDAGRQVARGFFKDHKDAIVARLPKDASTGPLARYAWLFTSTCRASSRDSISAYVTAEFANLPGGARVVHQAIEAMDQCIARRAVLAPELDGWLSGVKIPRSKR